jgi:hypothetical protein
MTAKGIPIALAVAATLLHAGITWATGPTQISGSQSGTLFLTNSPYVVTADITVPQNQTLTIQAGVVVQFTNVNIGAYIDGTLIARGTANNPILFTSDKAVKQPGQWKVIDLRTTGGTNSIMENCIVECGGAVGYSTENIHFDSESTSAAVITNCTIRSSGGHGISFYLSDGRVQNCVFSNNVNFALSMNANCLPVLRNNAAQGNGANAIEVAGNFFSRTGTWTRDNLPYTVTADLVVNGGVTNTIEPGVTVQFTNVNIGAYIDGTLIARGTTNSPILFTSDKAVKQPGQWKVIDFRTTGGTNSIMENCIVECAGAVGYSTENIHFDSESTSAAAITNCIIRSSGGHGISFYLSDGRVQNCVFSNNVNFALSMNANCLPVLRNNAAQANGANAIEVAANYFSRSGTWTRDNLPYTVTADLTVNNGVTLTPEPGVTVQFTNVNVGAFIQGTLMARGTSGSPIMFTSDKVVKQPGQWRGIDFQSTGGTNSILENCIVECAGAGAGSLGGNILFDSESTSGAVITNCAIRSSGGHGIRFLFSDPRVQNCVFSNNLNFAISMRVDSLPVLRNNSAQGNGANAIEVFANYVSRSGAWTRDNLPYTVTSDLYVNNGVTLTLEPGLAVQFTNVDVGAFIQGTLIARGTTGSPILFTSDKAVKKPGQWRVIDFQSTAGLNTVLENCIVEFAAATNGGYQENILFDTTSAPLLTNCTIRASSYDGIYCNLASNRISNCRILNNGRDGIRTGNLSSPIITNCAIFRGANFGVNNLDTSRIILARGNYWGDPSGPYDNSNADGQGLLNPSGLGDKVSEYVNWGSYLTSDPTGGELPVSLSVSSAGSQVLLSWPDSAAGYTLQSVTNLPVAANAWLTVTNPPEIVNSRYTVTDTAAGSRRFYRLIK